MGEILALLIKNAPAIIAVLRALEPIIVAAWPVVQKMIAQGIPEHQAWHAVIRTMEPGSVEEKHWFDRAMGDIG